MDLDNLIKNMKKEFDESIEDNKKRNKELISKFVLLKKLKDEGINSETDVKVVMSILCYNSLSFCCGLEKKCIFRDSVMSVLGMTKADFKEFKEKCDLKLLELLKEKKIIKGGN